MTLVIEAFVTFECKDPSNEFAWDRQFIPTEGDLVLSALVPFRDCQAAIVRIFDLETAGGRLRGVLRGVSESPVIIIAGEKHVGLVAVTDALERASGDLMMG